jgi:hypothetical protein
MTKYQHTLVYWIDGIHLGAQEGEVELITEPVAGFRAVLSTDPDAYCFESDRFIALANLKLNALFGQLGLEITEESLADELEVLREARRRRFGSGPYLVFVREDNVEEFSRLHEVETENFIVCRGGPPKDHLRRASRPHVLAALAALAVAAGAISRIDEVSDTIVFFREDGKPIYSYTLSMTGEPSVLRAISEETLESVTSWYHTISQDPQLERVGHLLVSSLQTKGDKLRSFLFAWAAIEILINKTFGVYEERFFKELDNGEHPESRRQYLRRVRSVMSSKYRLSDKFALIASLLSPESADEDVEQFKQAKNDRDKLLHGQDVHEASLPVQIVQELARKYLRIHLAVN